MVDLNPQATASLHIGKKHPSEVTATTAKLLQAEVERLPLAIHEDTYYFVGPEKQQTHCFY